MTQEIIMAFLFGVFYGTAVRAAFDSPEFWQLVRRVLSRAKQKAGELYNRTIILIREYRT